MVLVKQLTYRWIRQSWRVAYIQAASGQTYSALGELAKGLHLGGGHADGGGGGGEGEKLHGDWWFEGLRLRVVTERSRGKRTKDSEWRLDNSGYEKDKQ